MSGFIEELEPYVVRVSAVIPALNEEASIGGVVAGLPTSIDEVVVADNGSTDRTAELASLAGAHVVHEPRRGYGSACLAGLGRVIDERDAPPDVVLFLDADAADDPADIPALLAPIVGGEAELVIGSRARGEAERGSLTLPQRFGNRLACALLRAGFGAAYTDLGPFRAITASALRSLRMDDRDFGWTVQMQARAARRGVSHAEVPVAYRKRIGTSKISGTVSGVVRAGSKILSTIARERTRPIDAHTHVVVMARVPTPGRTKTRLVPALSPEDAAELQHRLTKRTLTRVAAFPHTVALAAANDRAVHDGARLYGAWRRYTPQRGDDLGQRMRNAVDEITVGHVGSVIVIGTDCPDLSHADLVAADVALETHDVVIGPARDGGYYLIGFSRGARGHVAAVFRGVPWGCDRVLDVTKDRLRASGLSFLELRELSDIDTPEDLAGLPSDLFGALTT